VQRNNNGAISMVRKKQLFRPDMKTIPCFSVQIG
jgi:hypothetical protein